MATNRQDIAMGQGVDSDPVIPPDVRQRYGITEDLHQEYFDTLLYGRNQNLAAEEQLFNNPTRGAFTYLTNVRGLGFLTNNKQFLLCGIYSHAYFRNLGGESDVAVDILHEILNTFAYITIKLGNTEKMHIPLHRIPSGGGVYGTTTAGATVIATPGVPQFSNIFWLKNPLFLGLQQDFSVMLRWMQLANSAANDPLTEFNDDTTSIKFFRIGLVGIEGRNWTNG